MLEIRIVLPHQYRHHWCFSHYERFCSFSKIEIKYRQLTFAWHLQSCSERRDQHVHAHHHPQVRQTDKQTIVLQELCQERKNTSYGCGLCEVHLCGKQCFALLHRRIRPYTCICNKCTCLFYMLCMICLHCF